MTIENDKKPEPTTPAVTEGPTADERMAYLESKMKEIVSDRDQWKSKHAVLAAQLDTSGKQPISETDVEKASKQDLMRSYLQTKEEKEKLFNELQNIRSESVKKEKLAVVKKHAKEMRIN